MLRLATALVAIGLMALPMFALAQQQPAPEAAKAEKKICRSEKMTGSLTRVRRICLTRAEWDELSLRTKHGHEDNVRGASGGCMAPSDVSTNPVMCGSR